MIPLSSKISSSPSRRTTRSSHSSPSSSLFSIEGGRLPGLVDDDTSPGEEEGDALVRHEADSLFEDRGEGVQTVAVTARHINLRGYKCGYLTLCPKNKNR